MIFTKTARFFVNISCAAVRAPTYNPLEMSVLKKQLSFGKCHNFHRCPQTEFDKDGEFAECITVFY